MTATGAGKKVQIGTTDTTMLRWKPQVKLTSPLVMELILDINAERTLDAVAATINVTGETGWRRDRQR